MPEKLQLKNHCYVLIQGDWIHPHASVMREKMIWYPERSRTLYEQHQYRPYINSVVTENAWIIATYPREKVRVINDFDGQWIYPNVQTYGASCNGITYTILGINASIPAIVMDGGESFLEVIKEYKKRIDLATKFYNNTSNE